MTDGHTRNQRNGGPDLQDLIAKAGRGGNWRHWWLLSALVTMVLGGYLLFGGNNDSGGPRYLTEAVARGRLAVAVTATGNLKPTNQVDVGSELSGTIVSVYVDEDEQVTKGQVLAQLDPSKFDDAVAKSRGTVAVAKASVQQAKATLDEARAKLTRYQEVARLSDNKVPSKTEMESAEAEAARATASLASAQASLTEAQAALQSDETDLAKTKITSPIDGVVLKRSVDPGQAVAAAFQAVTLFSLAEDLSKMKLEVNVDEADVGQVRVGLPASFTVDAWPDRTFAAVITRVGFDATDDDGVVSYPAVLQVENDQLILRPGMTATAEITTAVHDNVLLVPNAALRFTPTTDAKALKPSRGLVGSLMPGPPNDTTKASSPETADGSKQIWVLRESQVTSVLVKTGMTNGRYTEVTGGGLRVGDNVITEAVNKSDDRQ